MSRITREKLAWKQNQHKGQRAGVSQERGQWVAFLKSRANGSDLEGSICRRDGQESASASKKETRLGGRSGPPTAPTPPAEGPNSPVTQGQATKDAKQVAAKKKNKAGAATALSQAHSLRPALAGSKELGADDVSQKKKLTKKAPFTTQIVAPQTSACKKRKYSPASLPANKKTMKEAQSPRGSCSHSEVLFSPC